MSDYESRRDDARQAAHEDACAIDCLNCGHPDSDGLCPDCELQRAREKDALDELVEDLRAEVLAHHDTAWSRMPGAQVERRRAIEAALGRIRRGVGL